jgi:hypothetical protein
MLRATLRKLARGRGATPRRSSRAPNRRPTLEALEDRLVPSFAVQFGSTLIVKADPGSFGPPPFVIPHVRPILLEADLTDHTKLDVFDTGKLLGQFTIASIKTVDVGVAGLDAVNVDDVNGVPFAGLTSINLFGSGFDNSLNLVGSQAIIGNEDFTASRVGQNASLSLAGVDFQFLSGIASATDAWANPNPAFTLFVSTQSQSVFLSKPFLSPGEQLSGLSAGGNGPGTLIFAGKAEVVLEVESDNATVTLDAATADSAWKGIDVQLFGKNDTVNIDATPAGVSTEVQTLGQSDRVNVLANAGFVIVLGNTSASVVLGSNDADFSKSVTSGINRDVSVFGAGSLQVADGGNVTTKEQVNVTEATVSGSGLFGNSGVVVHYSATPLAIFTGRLANTYTVAPSHAGAHFGGFVEIADLFSLAGLTVLVSVDGKSGLSLGLFNKNPAAGNLFLVAPGGTFNPFIMTKPNGFEQVTFLFGLTSKVGYAGFGNPVHS